MSVHHIKKISSPSQSSYPLLCFPPFSNISLLLSSDRYHSGENLLFHHLLPFVVKFNGSWGDYD
ncbi:hypothetical protein LINGRAHAP2_LOCUS29878 [Linum grandiflorum]